MIDEACRPDAPGEKREGLTLERYAEVMAHMRHFPRSNRPEVLARLGLTGQRWESAVLAWTDALAEESAMEDEALSIRFGTTFAKTRARLKETQPPLPSLGLLPEKKTAPAAPAPVAIETAPSIVLDPVAPQVELPSYMLAATAPRPPLLAPALAPLSAAPLPMRVTSAQHPDLGATAEASNFPDRPVLPFQAGGTPEQALADVIARMTAAQGALPAEGGRQPRAHLGETVGLAPFPVGRVLPFAADAAGPPAPSSMPAGMRKLVSVEETQLSTDAPAGPALPFSSPSAPIPTHVPGLSIERYASLCVELSATPANAAQTLRRYQLTEQEWITLDAHWKARLSCEPGARATWESACSAYRTWLAQAGRGKT